MFWSLEILFKTGFTVFHRKFLSGNSGTFTSDNIHIVYVGVLSSSADMNSTCRKMTHKGMLGRGFTVIVFAEYLRIWRLMFVCFLEIQVYY